MYLRITCTSLFSLALIYLKIQISRSDLDICQPGKNDIIFLVDTSTSIQDSNLPGQTMDNWNYIMVFLSQIIGGLQYNTDPAVRVGLIPFSTTVDPTFSIGLSSNKDGLLASVETLTTHYYGGNTNISGALRQARYTFDQNRYGGRNKILVLITDGQSNVDEEMTSTAAQENRDSNITHFVIAITPYVNRLELQGIINNDPSFYYFEVDRFENLNLSVNMVLDRINCPTPPKGCNDVKADICFLLDSSGSIVQDDKKDYTDWNYMKKFLLDVIDQLKIGKDDNHISLIEFSSEALVIFNLDFSFSADVVKQKIMNISFIGSTTNTQDALTKMYNYVFVESRGDRPYAPNVAIVITDGKSNMISENTIPAANLAKSMGIRIFAIGLTNSIELKELEGIASNPKEQHVFTRQTISLVSTVVSNLIFNLCHQTCFTNCSTTNRCPTGYSLGWNIYNGKMIIGNDYHKIDGVNDATTCQNNCLQEQSCRSIEFIKKFSICNLSWATKATVPASDFFNDDNFEYYEWVCIKN